MDLKIKYCFLFLSLILVKNATASLREIFKTHHEKNKEKFTVLNEIYSQPEQIHISYGGCV